MPKILLDTSIIIDHLRQKDRSKTVLTALAENEYELFASILAHTESYSGKSVWERKDTKEAIEILFSGIKILPLEEKVSLKAGELRAKQNMGLGDAIIAATAIVNKIPLATLNIKHFEKIKGLTLWQEKLSKIHIK